ncbi:SET domain-containing protein [Hypoxylon sp. NC1633]|nr:SET domain-containing protein [Hypoxylon sp. NC1633]
MESHDELLAWATEQGVKLNGIAPKRIPGRGIGLVTTRAIKPNETVLEVPTPCLRTTSTVRKSITRHLPKALSVHGLLAADLALDASRKYAPWNAVCPTPADLSGMPLVWEPALCTRLPAAARALLAKQDAKLRRDWAAVSAAFAHLPEDRYRYAWQLVNTRTFYYASAMLARRARSRDDHMCLQPVADLFNHTDAGCDVAFDVNGFAVRAERAYGRGEELGICYGRHSGDFLLVEYGFVMRADENCWDEVLLDDVLVPRLSAAQREKLEEVGFLGKYVLDCETVCHRTQVAVRLLCCRAGEWRRFVDGVDDGERSQRQVDRIVLELLQELRRNAEMTIVEVKALDIGEEQEQGQGQRALQRGMLVERWRQIQCLVDIHIARLE